MCKLLTMHQIYHPKFNIGRLYLPRKEVISENNSYWNGHLLKQHNDWMLKLVKIHGQNKRMYSVTSNAKKYLNEITTKKEDKLKHKEKFKKINEPKE